MQFDISVVIPTLASPQRAWRLTTTLSALAEALRGHSVQVIVVGDGAAPDVADYDCLVQSSTQRRGRAATRNAGALAAEGARLLFLDDDIIVPPDFLASHLTLGDEVFASHAILDVPWLSQHADPRQMDNAGPALSERIAAFGDFSYAHVRSFGRRSRFEAWIQRHKDEAGNQFLGCTGGCLSIGRSTFAELGGFDEEFGLDWGVEDLELGYRAQCSGLEIRRIETDPVLHLGIAPEADERRSQAHELNRLRFAAKHGAAPAARLSGIPLT